MLLSDPLSQWFKKMFPPQATAIENHHYVHTAVNTKSQISKKFLQLFEEIIQREWKSFKQDYL